MSVLEIEATVTSRGQTTVPAPIRKALNVGKSGNIVFRLEESGRVTVSKKDIGEPDPVIGTFLSFLAADMMAHPGSLRPVTAEWLSTISEIVDGVEIDLDKPLSEQDE